MFKPFLRRKGSAACKGSIKGYTTVNEDMKTPRTIAVLGVFFGQGGRG